MGHKANIQKRTTRARVVSDHDEKAIAAFQDACQIAAIDSARAWLRGICRDLILYLECIAIIPGPQQIEQLNLMLDAHLDGTGNPVLRWRKLIQEAMKKLRNTCVLGKLSVRRMAFLSEPNDMIAKIDELSAADIAMAQQLSNALTLFSATQDLAPLFAARMTLNADIDSVFPPFASGELIQAVDDSC